MQEFDSATKALTLEKEHSKHLDTKINDLKEEVEKLRERNREQDRRESDYRATVKKYVCAGILIGRAGLEWMENGGV